MVPLASVVRQMEQLRGVDPGDVERAQATLDLASFVERALAAALAIAERPDDEHADRKYDAGAVDILQAVDYMAAHSDLRLLLPSLDEARVRSALERARERLS